MPREAAQAGPLVIRTIEFALDVDALDHTTMNAIGQRIEQQAGAESVTIEVRKSDDDGTRARGRRPDARTGRSRGGRGVQGDVEVHIDDHDDGKREVRVELKDAKHLTSPK